MQTHTFTIADGTVRYYALAEWRKTARTAAPPVYMLRAWIPPSAALRILAVEGVTYEYPRGQSYVLRLLLNVVGLGTGRTGIIVSLTHEAGTAQIDRHRDGSSSKTRWELSSIETFE